MIAKRKPYVRCPRIVYLLWVCCPSDSEEASIECEDRLGRCCVARLPYLRRIVGTVVPLTRQAGHSDCTNAKRELP